MSEMTKVVASFNSYERVLMFYKDVNNNVYIGHTFLYNGRDDSKYMLFLYKEETKHNGKPFINGQIRENSC